MTTLAPKELKKREASLPIAPAAPLMMITFPLKSNNSFIFFMCFVLIIIKK